MIFDLDKRTAALGVGEFSSFTLGPREAGEGTGGGIWRAQLGTRWHNELRGKASAEHGAAAAFEVVIAGQVFHRGWTLSFSGRIDQLIRPPAAPATRSRRATTPMLLLREIKTVTRPLPADETELRRDYPEYFVQLASYLALARLGALDSARALSADSQVARQLIVDVQPGSPGPPENTRSEPAEAAENYRAAEVSDAGDASSADSGSARPGTRHALRGELVFVEASAGLVQTIALTPADDVLFRAQLDRIVEFLDLRLRARERLRGLRYRPAFATPRPGQETTLAELTATFERRPLVLFEAPTGFGKTGVLLEFALGQLRSGHFDRALYLTSKSTGQLQVVRTLQGMTARLPNDAAGPATATARRETADTRNLIGYIAPPAPQSLSGDDTATTPVAFWHVRNKAEHCVNTTFHCVSANCAYLAGAPERWSKSGLARFYLDEHHARDLDTLRAAGRDARICPYEITRAALAFNDLWIGDYNYVFAPRNRGLFYEQPGFSAPRTLLLIDEAHNLPSRVADAYSHGFTAPEAFAVRDDLHRAHLPAPLISAWDHWCHFLHHLHPNDALPAAEEDDARHLLGEVAKHLVATAIDYAALGAISANALWEIPALLDDLTNTELPRLWWCPRAGELALTCLDASTAIGGTLREFGGVVLASATLTPVDGFTAACGLAVGDIAPTVRASNGPSTPGNAAHETSARPSAPERLGELNKRETRKLYRQLTSAAELLRVEEARDAASPALLHAHAPWREGSYDIAFDARVDTTFQHRSHHFATTAATITALRHAANGPVAVFFPSYAYADAIRQELGAFVFDPASGTERGAKDAPAFRVAVQPKLRDLAAQSAWVDESLLLGDALFLVLGSSFAESIDALGGRVTHAMVVGPALPEVNAVQRARLAEATRAGLGREEAFRRVYQIPGMTKVNQALGRLVRAPGQRARVLLHCRRFAEPGYLELLAPEYRQGTAITEEKDLLRWLEHY